LIECANWEQRKKSPRKGVSLLGGGGGGSAHRRGIHGDQKCHLGITRTSKMKALRDDDLQKGWEDLMDSLAGKKIGSSRVASN